MSKSIVRIVVYLAFVFHSPHAIADLADGDGVRPVRSFDEAISISLTDSGVKYRMVGKYNFVARHEEYVSDVVQPDGGRALDVYGYADGERNNLFRKEKDKRCVGRGLCVLTANIEFVFTIVNSKSSDKPMLRIEDVFYVKFE